MKQATERLANPERCVHPPIGKQKRWPSLSLTVVHAQERSAPAGREPICWKLLANLPGEDLAAAIEKLDWYAQRWKIETFHMVLKSGCQAAIGFKANQSPGHVLYPRLACVLADDGQPDHA